MSKLKKSYDKLWKFTACQRSQRPLVSVDVSQLFLNRHYSLTHYGLS